MHFFDQSHRTSASKLDQLGRREFLKSASAAACLSLVPESLIAEIGSLRSAAQTRGIEIGAMATLEQLTSASIGKLISQNFTLAGILFGEMEWGNHPGIVSDPDFGGLVRYLDTCKNLGLRTRARQIYSLENQPQGIGLRPDGSPKSKSELEKTLLKRVEQCCKPLKGRNAIIQVVDEVLADHDGGLRSNPFSDGLGEEYVDLLFHAAHEAAPDALLTYQEYGPETDAYGYYKKKTSDYLALLERLRKRNVPITGAAFGGFAFPAEGWPFMKKKFYKAVEGLDYDIHWSELTVIYTFCGSPNKWLPKSDEENDRVVNKVYSDIVEFMCQFKRLREITFFAPFDRNNTVETGTLCLFPYEKARPGIFASDLTPKPVYDNLVDIVARSKPKI